MTVPGSLSEERILEPAREIAVAGRSDVLVVGGGPAGVGAAGTAAALAMHQDIAPSALDPTDLVRQLRADGVRL
jgi:hypothetical protein